MSPTRPPLPTAEPTARAEPQQAAQEAGGGARRPAGGHLLVVIEARTGSEAAVAEAVAIARRDRAHVLLAAVPPRESLPLATAWEFGEALEDPMREAVNSVLHDRLAAAQAAAASAGVSSRAVTLPAPDSGPALARLAEEQGCDLIVVSCQRSNAVTRLLSGSLVPGLITAASAPVLVVHDAATKPVVGRAGIEPATDGL